MTSAVQSPYSSEQIAAWLRGLLTIAWADGDFDDQEQELIASITKDKLAPETNLESLDVIEPEELATVLGRGTPAAENFLRTAVMVAIADGTYSKSEDYLLHELCKALGEPENLLEALRHTLEFHPTEPVEQQLETPLVIAPTKRQLDALQPVRDWLDGLDIQDPRVARFLCKMIPSQCPFERDVKLFGRKIVHIPPLCKLNPLYDQLVGLRFRALSYLADECGEDVSEYI
ncbi:Mo-dependent nitrogenase C-terminal domain-containing protein [Fischerella thermalis]|jgi:tellurite resistance protein|uniref:Mo-dependent nitrogenase family protein n=1 Tax=Fischerella thermalis JSC-11 TaxID=741277 RepID=G6FQI8_9CYAN|nr:Mo-dependent nitrogenase C-terminal domain-containing protein [Fischerella thermalis]PLZ81151.1 nitrogenase [Fischerella thermalis WC217]PMB08268.1 nitrogenase [Fischerella thermalis CCMEE 5273]PMB09836.1 nitrogenase [Fischerella thermalis CCMEE 5328]RDH51111.1 nitrogenase [Mastigocladus laminosus WC112]EHC18073.1 Mo-dependent nitrogenase family protein [Fischerella thermalis JSC-11]